MDTLNNIFASGAFQVTSSRIASSWPWYVIRGAGFAALALMFLLMISGIGHITGLTYKYIEPIKAWAIHKALAIALVVAIIFHVGFLLIDHFVSFKFFDLIIPFKNQYSNGTTLFGLHINALSVGFGVIAMYLVFIIVASSLGWIDTRKGLWKNLHYLSYLAVILVFIHSLYSGSDLKYGIFRYAIILLFVLTIIAIVSRLLRSGTLKED